MRIYNFPIASSNLHFLHHNLSLTIDNIHREQFAFGISLDLEGSYFHSLNMSSNMLHFGIIRKIFNFPTASSNPHFLHHNFSLTTDNIHREQVAFVISLDLEGSYFCSLNMSSNTLDLVGEQKC